jgi:hypothetical protein
MRLIRLLSLALLTAMALIPATSQAQTLLGTVSGTVTDEQGGALPGATLSLTGKTGTKTAATDAAGSYRFVAVEPGTYSLSAELSGFAPRKRENISVEIGKNAAVDFGLKVGGLTDTVEVVGEAPIVDTTTTATDNSLDQDLLFNLPLGRFTADLLNYTPGVNAGSAFGGGSDVSNGLYLDGVDTRSPADGTAWMFVNFNIVEEVQVQGLGASAEYGSFTGAVVNTITRSGGNDMSGLFDVQYTNDSLAGDNVSAAQLAANPDLGNSAKTTKYLDFTAQFGGPIVKDKVFYFLSAQRLDSREDPTGPRTEYKELSPRLNGKLTFLPTPSDTITAQAQYDQFNVTGRSGWDSQREDDDVGTQEEAPNVEWNVQWRHLFGSNTFLEAKLVGWDGYFDLFPVEAGFGKSGHYDVTTGRYTVSAGYRTLYDRKRQQLNAAVTHYADKWGKHELKFGLEIERSNSRNRNTYENGITYYDSTEYYPVGQYYGYDSSYDFNSKIHRNSFFVQDAWRVNSRLTINAGARLDNASGIDGSGDVGTVYKFTEVSPRLGFALDLTGDQKTVLKGHYGDFVDALTATYFRYAIPRHANYEGYCYDPESNDFVGPEGNHFSLCREVTYPLYNVDPDIKHPKVQQYTATVERALSSDTRLAVTGIYRKWKNFVDTVLPDATWTPSETTNDLTGQPLGFYALDDDNLTNFLITNPDGFQYRDANGNILGTAHAKRDYKAVMVVLNKRFSHGWQAQASYVYSKAEGTVDNTGNGTRTSTFLSPNLALINADGPMSYDRPHEFKLLGTFVIPKIDISISPYWRSISGYPIGATQSVSRSETNFPFALVSSAARSIQIEPRDTRHTQFQHKLDIRTEKIFKLNDKDRVAVYADFFNVFNANYDTDILNSTSDEFFGGPASITQPRQITLGARWSF